MHILVGPHSAAAYIAEKNRPTSGPEWAVIFRRNVAGFFRRNGAKHYEQALSEIKSGQKRSHWMWYIFPQFDGLAFSETSKRYSIKSVDEARAYLDHPVLGRRLLESAEAVICIEGRSASEIFGSPDDLKLRSCATLFACIQPPGSVFDRLIEKCYRGTRDSKTQQLLGIVPQV